MIVVLMAGGGKMTKVARIGDGSLADRPYSLYSVGR